MTLKERVQQDLRDAMRARDESRKAALRMLLSAVQLAEVQSGELDDEGVQRVLIQEIRRREGALELIRKGGREDLAAEEVHQLEILRAYLPQMLSEDELRAVIQEVIAETGASSVADLGNVMKVLMPRIKGKADGKLANQLAREALTK